MGSDWIVISAGFVFIAILSSPLWLERWTKDDGRTYGTLWEEEA